MSFGFGFGLPSWQTLSGGFTPASLFSAGEQGAWYDPSDLTTLFTNSAGTVPVTGVEQFVGLMLDKSKGLVLGSELVTNGDFSSGTTGWAISAGTNTLTASVVSGAARLAFTFVAGAGQFSQGIAVTAGKTYRITATASVVSGTVNANISVRSTNDSGTSSNLGFQTIAGSGTTNISFVYLATSTTTVYLSAYFFTSSCIIDLDNISVRELPGNHATSTGTKRPKLAARYNLLTYTEAFSNAAWGAFANGGATPPTKSTTTGLNPFGVNTTIDVVTFPVVIAGAGQISILSQNAGQALFNVQTTFSIYARVQSGTGTIYISVQDNLAGPTGGNFYTSGAQTLTTTWQRISVTGTRTSGSGSSNPTIGFDTRAAAGQTNAAPLVVELWGADFRPTSQATGLIGPTYQRVVDAATYDTAGFLPYLEFDGLSWSMSTGSIDFTATDKMTVWAGVRKLSASAGVIAELSAILNTNDGSFLLGSDTNLSNAYFPALRGNSNGYYDCVPYAAPVTNVLGISYNIGGASLATEIVPRINSVVVQTNGAGTAGTGNFGNYPLFIGARNNASLYFNGRLTSLIVRGAQSTQSQIEATESWVNGKTGAY